MNAAVQGVKRIVTYTLPSTSDGFICLWCSTRLLLTSFECNLACSPGFGFGVVVSPIPFDLLLGQGVHKLGFTAATPFCDILFRILWHRVC